MLTRIFSKFHICFLPLAFIYLELTLKALTKNSYKQLPLLLLFVISFGLLFAVLLNLISNSKVRKAVTFTTVFLVSFYFLLEFYLFRAFGYFYPPETIMHMSTGVLESFSGSVWQTITSGLYAVPVFFAPAAIILFVPLKKSHSSFRNALRSSALLLAAAFALEGAATALVFNSAELKEQYKSSYEFNSATKKFGLLCASKLNCVYSHSATSQVYDIEFSSPEKSDRKADHNAYDIDFEALTAEEENESIKALHSYYSSLLPTERSEYTGLFKGKNLIFICAEAFSPYCISEEKTPTLFKLSNNGFVFENYYNPSFAESTSGGEYALLLSQVPKRASGEVGLSMSLTGKNNMLYSLPSLFASSGYSCKGYHNNSYTYYSRNVTHPKMNMSWYGVGGSVQKDGHSSLDLGSVLSPGWPRSDKELIEHTFDHYALADEPFFTYYLTVSGHNNYSFSENTQSRNNASIYENTFRSEKIKAYLSCQYELEKALTLLLEKLESTGNLDDTVIVLSNDHYPYGLSSTWAGNEGRDYLSELSGGKSADAFEKERGCLIIYNSTLNEPIIVSKPVSAFDVTPTVLNLFGISYESRFFVGSDALASDKGLVFLSDGSIMTDGFRYYAEAGKLVNIKSVSENEITEIKQAVKNKIRFSFLARRNDYFKVLKPFI